MRPQAQPHRQAGYLQLQGYDECISGPGEQHLRPIGDGHEAGASAQGQSTEAFAGAAAV